MRTRTSNPGRLSVRFRRRICHHQTKMVDFKRHRYPYCVVWTSIPGLTWLFPFIGHVGICLSNGVITDFSGPYRVTEDQMGFGNPRKYWQLDPARAQGGQVGWDEAVTRAAEVYRGRMYNLFCDNCHSHVVTALNYCAYDGKSNWTLISLWLRLSIYSRYVSYFEAIRTYVPFCILVTLATVLFFAC